MFLEFLGVLLVLGICGTGACLLLQNAERIWTGLATFLERWWGGCVWLITGGWRYDNFPRLGKGFWRRLKSRRKMRALGEKHKVEADHMVKMLERKKAKHAELMNEWEIELKRVTHPNWTGSLEDRNREKMALLVESLLERKRRVSEQKPVGTRAGLITTDYIVAQKITSDRIWV